MEQGFRGPRANSVWRQHEAGERQGIDGAAGCGWRVDRRRGAQGGEFSGDCQCRTIVVGDLMTTLFYFLLTLFLVICLMLIMLVLIQKGRGGGLAGAFGGGGGNTAFGTKTGDVLTWATSIVFALFVLLAVVLNLV